MNAILSLMILAVGAPPQTDPTLEGNEVYVCTFEPGVVGDDANYDQWPDRWTRIRGPGHPHYIPVAIGNDPHRDGDSNAGCLRVGLDGGSVALSTPPIKISSQFAYKASIKFKSLNMRRNTVSLELVLLDSAQQLVQSYRSPTHGHRNEWTEILIPSVTPKSKEIKFAVVRLHVHGGSVPDLGGSVFFDDLRLNRSPQVALRASVPHHIYVNPTDVEIMCRVSGISRSRRGLKLVLEMEGVEGEPITQAIPLDDRDESSAKGETGQFLAADNSASESEDSDTYDRPIKWKPQLGPDAYGFYRVRSWLVDESQRKLTGAGDHQTDGLHGGLQQEIHIVVSPSLPASLKGEFGWSISQQQTDMDLRHLGELVALSGIHWLKYPVWIGADDAQRADALARFAEELKSDGIELVGVLDRPPEETREMFASSQGPLVAAAVFSEDDDAWRRVLDPVMTRLSLTVRWWQIGADDDLSFMGFPDLATRFADIRQHMQKFGQEVQLGLGWSWLREPPVRETGAWDYLNYSVNTPLHPQPEMTGDELQEYLDATAGDTVGRWVALQPLAAPAEDGENIRQREQRRARDMVLRMVAAKVGGAERVIVPRPFDRDTGLVLEDGTPGTLFLPWQTAARMLGGATYLGSLQLPSGSPNHVFQRGEEGIMVVWNDRDLQSGEQPVEEVLYLGDEVVAFDLWGGHRPVGKRTVKKDKWSQPVQTVAVNREPQFLVGINPYIARWRIGFTLETPRLASVFGRRQHLKFKFQNTFPSSTTGTYQLPKTTGGEDAWNIPRRRQRYKLAADEATDRAFEIKLSPNTSTGKRPVEFEFEVEGENTYRFTVFRDVQVGLGGVKIDLNARLDGSGEDARMIVEMVVINNTDKPVSLRCLLFTPKRRRQRIQILDLGRGRTTRRFVLHKGSELLGQQLSLRAEEIDGPRILNYRIRPVR